MQFKKFVFFFYPTKRKYFQYFSKRKQYLTEKKMLNQLNDANSGLILGDVEFSFFFEYCENRDKNKKFNTLMKLGCFKTLKNK